MEMKKNHEVYEPIQVKDYRELIKNSTEKFGEKIAFKYKKRDKNKEVTYVEKNFNCFAEEIKALSTKLLEMGLEEKKIAIISDNRYEWCVSYLAITTGNMVVVPLDKMLPPNEIESLITRSGAIAAIFEEKYKETMQNIKKSGKTNLKYLINMEEGNQKDEILDWKELVEIGQKMVDTGDERYNSIKIDKDKLSVLLFTSGTTSKPKGVMISQHNVCANITAMSTFSRMYPTDTLLSFLPLHHTFECTITFLYGYCCGATIAFCDGLKYIPKNLVEYQVTVLVAVPQVLEAMYKKINKAIAEKGKTELIRKMTKISNTLLKCKIDIRKIVFKQVLDQLGGHLRQLFYGGAPMDKDTIIGYNNFGITQLQGYGLTETAPLVTAETDKEKRPGSIGFPIPGLELKFIDKDEEGIGEIIVKGPNVMLGYYENEELTEEAIQDGWFRTGDYGYQDEDGFVYITGRKKDIIVLKNGKNIYPLELEFLISKLPYVIENMVYKTQKGNAGDLLCAKIVYDKEIIKDVLGDKKEEEYQELVWKDIKEMNKQLPDYKHIRKITITTEPMVKTTTQKIKRAEELKKIASND